MVLIYLENKRSKSGKLASSDRISCIKSGTLIKEEIAFCLATILDIVVNGLQSHWCNNLKQNYYSDFITRIIYYSNFIYTE